jgi:hypothetical protein
MDNDTEEVAKATTPSGGSASESDLVWGGEAIGREINRTASQVYHLLEIGALAGAAAKLGHKTIVGSKRALRKLPFNK